MCISAHDIFTSSKSWQQRPCVHLKCLACKVFQVLREITARCSGGDRIMFAANCHCALWHTAHTLLTLVPRWSHWSNTCNTVPSHWSHTANTAQTDHTSQTGLESPLKCLHIRVPYTASLNTMNHIVYYFHIIFYQYIPQILICGHHIHTKLPLLHFNELNVGVGVSVGGCILCWPVHWWSVTRLLLHYKVVEISSVSVDLSACSCNKLLPHRVSAAIFSPIWQKELCGVCHPDSNPRHLKRCCVTKHYYDRNDVNTSCTLTSNGHPKRLLGRVSPGKSGNKGISWVQIGSA